VNCLPKSLKLLPDSEVSRHFGPKTLWTQDTSDLRHFGTGAEVSVRHFGTAAEVSGHFGISAEMSVRHFGTEVSLV